MSGSRVAIDHARGRDRARPSPSPASTTSTTRSPRPPAAFRSGSQLEDVIRPGSSRSPPAFGRAERIEIGSRVALDPADQEPGRRERGVPDADRRRPRGSDGRRRARSPDRAQRRDRRRPRHLLDLGRRLRAARAERRAASSARARAPPELALRLKYAGVPPERLEVARTRSSRHSTARSQRDGGRPLYALPTYTALLELRDLLADRGHARPYWESA